MNRDFNLTVDLKKNIFILKIEKNISRNGGQDSFSVSKKNYPEFNRGI